MKKKVGMQFSHWKEITNTILWDFLPGSVLLSKVLNDLEKVMNNGRTETADSITVIAGIKIKSWLCKAAEKHCDHGQLEIKWQMKFHVGYRKMVDIIITDKICSWIKKQTMKMSAPYPGRCQKSNQIIWKALENKPEHTSKNVRWSRIFINMGSFCSFIFERMK